MRPHVPHAIGDLLGRSTTTIIAALREQIASARAGACLAENVLADGSDLEVARKQMAELEHEGDYARDRLVKVLSTTLATPIDREDLFRVSRSIDDVLDGLRDFVRQLDLFRVRHQQLLAPLAGIISTLDLLDATIEDLNSRRGNLGTRALAVKKESNTVRLSFYEGTAAVIEEGTATDDVLRCLELFRRLEAVCGYLVEAADGLADAGIKRGG